MHLVRDEDLVEGLDCKAPQLTKQCGCPKKMRYRREEKDKRSIVCGHCKQKGYNQRTVLGNKSEPFRERPPYPNITAMMVLPLATSIY